MKRDVDVLDLGKELPRKELPRALEKADDEL
jgi:hypothetical protein